MNFRVGLVVWAVPATIATVGVKLLPSGPYEVGVPIVGFAAILLGLGLIYFQIPAGREKSLKERAYVTGAASGHLAAPPEEGYQFGLRASSGARGTRLGRASLTLLVEGVLVVALAFLLGMF